MPGGRLLRVSSLVLLIAAIVMLGRGRHTIAITGEIIIDDLDSGFTPSGGFLSAGSGGYNGHFYYTYNATSADEAFGTWRPTLPTTRYYYVYAYIASGHTTTQNAQYKITHQSGTSTVAVNQDQSPVGFRFLGGYRLSAGTSSSVRLGDATGEAYLSKQIGFDAMKFAPKCNYLTEDELRNDPQPECRGTYVFDPGTGNFMSRSQLLANASYFTSQGWSMNFLWYAPEANITITTGNGIQWSGCHFGTSPHAGSTCPVSPLDFSRATSTVPYGFMDGTFAQDVVFHVWGDGSSFISRVCANFTSSKTNPVPTVSGYKWNDLNGDGVWQTGSEPPIANWPVNLYDPDGHAYATTYTAADGSYHFSITTRPGTYQVIEGSVPGWNATTGLTIPVSIPEGAGNTDFSGMNFGNEQITPTPTSVPPTATDTPTSPPPATDTPTSPPPATDTPTSPPPATDTPTSPPPATDTPAATPTATRTATPSRTPTVGVQLTGTPTLRTTPRLLGGVAAYPPTPSGSGGGRIAGVIAAALASVLALSGACWWANRRARFGG